MKFALAIIGGVAALALIVFVAFIVGTRRAAQSVTLPPAEVRIIERRTEKKLEQNAKKASDAESEIMNASPDDLLRLFRDQLREDSAAATGQPPGL